MVEIKNVSFTYSGGNRQIKNVQGGNLKAVNFSIKKGECILLCGRSGCGKTTITRLINGLIPDYYGRNISGERMIAHTDISDMKMYEIAEKVGSVFQNPKTQFFHMNVDDEIVFGLENKAVSSRSLRNRLDEVTKELGIEKLRGRRIFDLSGGEKQKIAFASVYAMSPDIYLLDEPSSNLDMKTIQEFREYIRKLKENGKTIIIAEHRIYYLMDIVDRIAYMESGEIKWQKSSDEFKKMSEDQRIKLGLRAIDYKSVHPLGQQKKKDSPNVMNKVNSKECDEHLRIEVSNISLFQKKKQIQKDISFHAGCGEVIAITGENGAGKTTFLRTLCGLHKEYTGAFTVNQEKADEKTRRKMSYLVMQDVNYELFADSVWNECGLGIKNPDTGKTEQTLGQLDLLEYKDVHPNTLSGGQKQRLVVATSVISNKKIICFDEPTSGLDYDSMIRVANLIIELSKKSIVFVVTHDYEFICQACTRMIHFNEETMNADVPVNRENELQIKELLKIGNKKIKEKRC